MRRSLRFQPSSQKRISGILLSSARKASTPATTRGSSRSTPSSSLKRTRRPSPGAPLVLSVRPVGQPGEEVADGPGGVRYALEPYLDVVGCLGRVRDDHIQHEDHEHIDGDLLSVHRHRGLPRFWCVCSFWGASVTRVISTHEGPRLSTGPFSSGSGGI